MKLHIAQKTGTVLSISSAILIFSLAYLPDYSLTSFAAGSLINLAGTTINAPITVIIPITVNAQNAQICASVASGGSQSCQQIVLNPSQNSFNPVSVDMSTSTPTFTSSPTTGSTSSTIASPSTAQSAPAITSSPTTSVPISPTQNVPTNGHTQNVPTNPTSKVPTNPGHSSSSSGGNSGSGSSGSNSGPSSGGGSGSGSSSGSGSK